jgi:predicted NBD/HSP70 family sugar kinase
MCRSGTFVSERCGLPVGFGHDVRAGGLAERTMGAAQGCDDVLFMPIGTGVSGAMYVAGRLIENKYAGEIGHIDVRFRRTLRVRGTGLPGGGRLRSGHREAVQPGDGWLRGRR